MSGKTHSNNENAPQTFFFFAFGKKNHPPSQSALVLPITRESARLVRAAGIAQAVGDGHELEVVLPRPVDEPGHEDVDGALVRLVHERDVAVAARARALELGLALLRSLAVPVAAVNVVGDDLVAERAHRVERLAARRQVRGTHVRGLAAKYVDKRLLQLLHLLGDGAGLQVAEVGVAPETGGVG